MLRTWIMALCLLMATTAMAFADGRTVVVAHDATWPPMEFTDKEGNIVGYAVDYIDAVAAEAGFTVVHKSVAWDGIFAGLAGKKYDLIASSVTITDERAQRMDFTNPYYEVRQAVLVPKDTNPASMDDLKGKRLGAQIGTTGYMAIVDSKDIVAKTFDEIGMAMAALASGRIDGVVCDDPVATNYILENAEYAEKLKVAFVIPAEIPEYYGFVAAKGNTELVELVNKGIEQVKAKGIEDELRKKWIGQ